ncbi:MAG: VCBS repeat-containing protein [Rhodothermales bacterium]|nr:VCBS repeat-containing protein [Rhodothermales bacterium]
MRLPTIILAVLLVIPASGQSLQFEDATETFGMRIQGRGHGVAVRDFDRDGWPDLYVASSNGKSALFRNNQGVFEDVTAAAGVEAEGGYAAPLWADLDNDGWADLIVVGPNAANRLFMSNGDGSFRDVSADSGLDLQARAASVAAGDFDADGLTDLFLAVDDAADLLYRNLGDGRFEDVSRRGGIAGPETSVAMQAVWFDYDHNGSQDLIVVHDGFTDSRLHRNLGYLPLVDQGRSTGFYDVGSGNSMGIAVADVDGNGWEDIYVTRIGEAGLYLNQEGNGFVLIEDALGAWRNGMAWGTVFADFDNDRDQDLFVVNTTGFDGTRTLLYENRNLWFYDQSQSASASLSTETQGLAAADIDLDGMVDLIIPDHDGRIRVLRGTSPSPGNWLKIQLEGTSGSRDAIGARVEALVDGQWISRFVSGGDSFCSQSENVLHFGLGSATRADQLRVYWVGDAQGEQFGALAAGNHLITEGSGAPAGTGVAPELPVSQDLIEAFPNPLTADTKLKVTLSKPGWARISIWDVQGRRVAQVSERVLPAGASEIAWPESRWGTGIYFVRLETESGVVTTAALSLR